MKRFKNWSILLLSRHNGRMIEKIVLFCMSSLVVVNEMVRKRGQVRGADVVSVALYENSAKTPGFKFAGSQEPYDGS